MPKLREQNIWQAIAFLACAGVLWIHLADFGVSEFSGGWLTGKILMMADIGAVLFLSALVFTFLLPRAGAVVGLVAIALCLPIYLYLVMPGPYRRIFKGQYSVPLQREFVWNSWAIAGLMTLILAAALSIPHCYSGQSPDKFYKGRSQEKHSSNGWNFSCFAAPVNEQDGFRPTAPCARCLAGMDQRFGFSLSALFIFSWRRSPSNSETSKAERSSSGDHGSI